MHKICWFFCMCSVFDGINFKCMVKIIPSTCVCETWHISYLKEIAVKLQPNNHWQYLHHCQHYKVAFASVSVRPYRLAKHIVVGSLSFTMALNNWILESLSKAAKHRRSHYGLLVGENTIGKSKANCIPIPSVLCSRIHCAITLRDDKVFLRDDVSIL